MLLAARVKPRQELSVFYDNWTIPKTNFSNSNKSEMTTKVGQDFDQTLQIFTDSYDLEEWFV